MINPDQEPNTTQQVPLSAERTSSTEQEVPTENTFCPTNHSPRLSDAELTPSTSTSLPDHSTTSQSEDQLMVADEGEEAQEEIDLEFITDVWASNFEVEFAKIQSIISSNRFTYVAFDTEFAGFLRFGPESKYEQVRQNVNSLKLIQLGITLANEDKECPSPVATWQFNFHFDKTSDHYQTEAINVLETARINLEQHARHGIKKEVFSHLFSKSNLVRNPTLAWVAFNGRYDFGYLLNLVDLSPLPFNENCFIKKCGEAFSKFYDVKLLRDDKRSLHYQLLDEQIARPQQAHQAGSDCLSTLKLFFRTVDNLQAKGRERDIVSNCINGLQEEFENQRSGAFGHTKHQQQNIFDIIRGYQDQLQRYKHDVKSSRKEKKLMHQNNVHYHQQRSSVQFGSSRPPANSFQHSMPSHVVRAGGPISHSGLGYNTVNHHAMMQPIQQQYQQMHGSGGQLQQYSSHIPHTMAFATATSQYSMIGQHHQMNHHHQPRASTVQASRAPTHQQIGHRPVYNYQLGAAASAQKAANIQQPQPYSQQQQQQQQQYYAENPKMCLSSECFYPTPLSSYESQSTQVSSSSQESSSQQQQYQREAQSQQPSGAYFDGHHQQREVTNYVAWKHMRPQMYHHQSSMQYPASATGANQTSTYGGYVGGQQGYHQKSSGTNRMAQPLAQSNNAKNGFIVDEKNRLVRVRDC